MAYAQRSSTGVTDTWTPPRILAAAVGAVYTLIGILGFFVTGFDGFASHAGGESLLGFQVNPLHNIVHLAVGLAGLAMSRRTDTARTYGWILVVAYGAVFLYGLFAVGQPDINFLALNAADNVLHILTVGLGLAMALLPVRRTARA